MFPMLDMDGICAIDPMYKPACANALRGLSAGNATCDTLAFRVNDGFSAAALTLSAPAEADTWLLLLLSCGSPPFKLSALHSCFLSCSSIAILCCG